MDEETAGEIERLVQNLDRRFKRGIDQKTAVFPSQKAIVIMGKDRCLEGEQMIWGFPRFDGRGLMINARAETALERRSFRESILNRRCVIPAKGFWEWNQSKERFAFERPDSETLFMAGCYDCFEGQERFVILTTEANPSVKPVHERMPLVLERSELEDWVTDDSSPEYFLHKTPVLLKREAEYEQMRLF